MVCSQSKLSPQEVRTKMLSEGHHSKQFTTSDTISSLGLAEGSAGVCDHVFVSIFVELGQDSS